MSRRNERRVCLLGPKWRHCAYVVFRVLCQAKNIDCKSLTHRHVQYCTKHTHTRTRSRTTHNTCQFYVKRVLGPGTKLIPSILSWSQQKRLEDDVLNNLITPNKKDAASFKKKKKRKKKKKLPPLTPKSSFTKKKKKKSFYLCTTKFRTIMTDCTSY